MRVSCSNKHSLQVLCGHHRISTTMIFLLLLSIGYDYIITHSSCFQSGSAAFVVFAVVVAAVAVATAVAAIAGAVVAVPGVMMVVELLLPLLLLLLSLLLVFLLWLSSFCLLGGHGRRRGRRCLCCWCSYLECRCRWCCTDTAEWWSVVVAVLFGVASG